MMARPARWLALIGLLALTACRPDTVRLDYGYPEDTTFRYSMRMRAEADWRLSGPEGPSEDEGSAEVVFDVFEEIDSVEGAGAVVDVTIDPVEVVEEENLLVPTETRSFTLRLGRDGERLEVLEVDGVPASALEQDQLSFIDTYRPLLPLEPVRIGSEWSANQAYDLPSGFQEIRMRGSLDALTVDTRGDVARLSYTGRGPLAGPVNLPQGTAELTGTSEVEMDAELDIDDGYLRSASSVIASDFDVRLTTSPGELPRTGPLHQVLRIDIERTG